MTSVGFRRVLGLASLTLISACGGGGGDGATAPPPPSAPPPGPTVGSISGRVTASSTGAGIDAASITTSPSVGTATTDAQGNYTIANVAPGSYTLTAAKTGYSNNTASVTVAAGQTAAANIALTLAAPIYSYSQTGVIQGPTDGVASVAVSPDGATLAYGTFADNLVHVVDIATMRETRTLAGHNNRVTELAFSPDSRYLASSGTVNLPPNVDGSVRLWDLTTGTQVATVATPGTSELRFAPNGSALVGASGGDPVSIRVWNPTTLALMRTITGVFRFAALNPDASRVASGGRNDMLAVHDFSTGAQVATFTGHTGWVTFAAYSANGQVLASAGEDRTIRLRNAQSGTVTQTLTGHTSYPDFLAFSPDGTILASAGSGINITRSGNSVSISLSSADRLLRLWNLSSGTELTRVNLSGDVLAGAAFSADWRVLVTGSSAGAVRVFRRAQ